MGLQRLQGLQGVTVCYKLLQGVTRGYRWLQRVREGDKALIGSDRGLQRVTTGYRE